jgi:hypothetical protein
MSGRVMLRECVSLRRLGVGISVEIKEGWKIGL